MKTALATQAPATATDTLERLKHSLPSVRNMAEADRSEVAMMVSKLSVPADTAWSMARVAALLEPYYDKGTPQLVKQMEAEDWAAALAEYPRWAIQNAARWWKGEGNAERRKRPLEGDIAARCRVEMGAVFAAKIALSKPPVPKRETPPRDITPEELEARRAFAAQVMAGYRTGKQEAAE